MINNKIKCYDPRDNTEKETNNPAFLAGQALEYISEASKLKLSDDFYLTLIYYANYYEEEIKNYTVT